MTVEPGCVSHKSASIPGTPLPLWFWSGIDCPDRKLERSIFPRGNSISVFISGKFSFSLWFWSGVIVFMLRHHTHKTVLTGSRRELYLQTCLFQECLSLWLWSGVVVLLLWPHTHKIVLTRGQRLVYVLMLVITHKLIRAGWTYLVEFLCSFYKLFVPDFFWSFVFVRGLPCLCLGIYMHNTVPFGGWRPKVFLSMLYKMSKVQK